MRWIVDTNVPLRLVRRSDPLCRTAFRALAFLARRGDELCVVPQTIYEFWNVCTRPADRNGFGLSIEEADRAASRVERRLRLLHDTPALYAEWRKLVVVHRVAGAQAHDARIAAAVIVHRPAQLLTFNTADFARFAGVVAANPQDVRP